MLNEEITKQENHGNGSSSQTPEFDSTNSGGEREEGSRNHTNNEEMMKAQVNKLIQGSGIGVTLEKQLLVILLLV